MCIASHRSIYYPLETSNKHEVGRAVHPSSEAGHARQDLYSKDEYDNLTVSHRVLDF